MFNVYMDDTRVGPIYDPYCVQLETHADWDSWVTVRHVEHVKELLLAGLVKDMSLDHDMGPGRPTGSDLVRWMCNNDVMPSGTIAVHSANGEGCKEMLSLLDSWERAKSL